MGKGKSNKGAGEAKANGKATSNQSGKGKGTAQAGNSGGGKTRQAQGNPKDAKKPGMPALRPKDWSCNIMDYDSACSQLRSLGDTVLSSHHSQGRGAGGCFDADVDGGKRAMLCKNGLAGG